MPTLWDTDPRGGKHQTGSGDRVFGARRSLAGCAWLAPASDAQCRKRERGNDRGNRHHGVDGTVVAGHPNPSRIPPRSEPTIDPLRPIPFAQLTPVAAWDRTQPMKQA